MSTQDQSPPLSADANAPDAWIWTRFYTTSADDWRPVYEVEKGTPGLGPYWCSGYAYDPDRAIICAWMRPGADVRTYWPEAEQVTQEEPSALRFSDRFPEPAWWATSPENPALAGRQSEQSAQTAAPASSETPHAKGPERP